MGVVTKNATNAAQFLLSSGPETGSASPTLVYHTLNEIGGELGLLLLSRLRLILYGVHLLLFHLNLDVSDSGRHLAVDDEVGRRGRRLSDFILTYDFDSSTALVIH